MLAPRELAPFHGEPADAAGGLRWVDPETGESVGVSSDRGVRLRYQAALRAELARWDQLARRPGLGHSVWSSATDFERVVRAVLGELT